MVRLFGRSLPLWPTVITVVGVLLMLGLSLWQVQRLYWKEALIAERQAGMARPAEALPATIAQPLDWHYRRVRVTGIFDHDREALLAARSLNGNVGYHLVTPLLRDDGGAVLVDRGWIPLALKEPSRRPETLVAGRQTVEGIARVGQEPGFFTPEAQPDENFWFIVEIPAMAADMGLDNVAPVFVEAGPTPEGTWPIGGQTRIDLPNDHLQYAITWFLLAIALAVVYVVYVRQQGRE